MKSKPETKSYDHHLYYLYEIGTNQTVTAEQLQPGEFITYNFDWHMKLQPECPHCGVYTKPIPNPPICSNCGNNIYLVNDVSEEAQI